jgi:peptidyl-prolyl cis-trans isomerase SurA
MINKIYRQIIILLTVVTLSPYCYAAEEVDSIVAIVEEDVVLRSELDTRVRTITNQLMEQGTPLPPESVMYWTD